MRQYALLRPTRHFTVLVTVEIVEVISRIPSLGNQPFGLFQRLSQSLAVALPQRQRLNRQRLFILQADQGKVIRRGCWRYDPAVAVGLELFAQLAVNQRLDIVGLVLPTLVAG